MTVKDVVISGRGGTRPDEHLLKPTTTAKKEMKATYHEEQVRAYSSHRYFLKIVSLQATAANLKDVSMSYHNLQQKRLSRYHTKAEKTT